MVFRAATIAFAALSMCADSQPTRDQLTEAVSATSVEMSGTYLYLDGDQFVYVCGGSLCADILVRDKFLQENVGQLNGKQVKVLVRRVKVCLNDRMTVECVRSSSGTALQILKWIFPAGDVRAP